MLHADCHRHLLVLQQQLHLHATPPYRRDMQPTPVHLIHHHRDHALHHHQIVGAKRLLDCRVMVLLLIHHLHHHHRPARAQAHHHAHRAAAHALRGPVHLALMPLVLLRQAMLSLLHQLTTTTMLTMLTSIMLETVMLMTTRLCASIVKLSSMLIMSHDVHLWHDGVMLLRSAVSAMLCHQCM